MASPGEELAADDSTRARKVLEQLILVIIVVVGVAILTYMLLIRRGPPGLSIEEFPFRAYVEHLDTASGTLSITNTAETGIGYSLAYSLTEEREEYAEVLFHFAEPQDLSAYETIAVTVVFDDSAAGCDLALSDAAGNKAWVRLRDLPPQAVTVDDNGSPVYRVPLRGSFAEINLTQVQVIGCSAGTAFTSGQHAFTIHDIRFLR